MVSDPKKVLSSWPSIEDFRKMVDDLKVPGFPDVSVLMRAHQRNLEALSTANRIALEGAQAVARRHMEIMQMTMTELTGTVKLFSGDDGPQEKAKKQADMLKAAYERAVNDTKEMGELIQKSNGEALQALNQRVTESIEELAHMNVAPHKY